MDEAQLMLEKPKETKIKKLKHALGRVSPAMYVAIFALISVVATTTTSAVLYFKQNEATQIRIGHDTEMLQSQIEKTNQEMKETNVANAASDKGLDEKITTDQGVIARLSKQVDDVSGLKNRIDSLATQAVLDVLQHKIESGVVSDYFYVSKVTFTSNDGRLETVVIDVDTQPLMNGVYLGYGNFNLDDRTLRGRSLEIVNKVKDFYMSSKESGNPIVWDEKTLAPLTVKNFSIGIYVNGSFLLKGEK